jgi:hypothetical protein
MNLATEKAEELVVNVVDNVTAAVADKFGEGANGAVASREEPNHNQHHHGVNIWFAYGQLFLLCFALYSYIAKIPSASQSPWEWAAPSLPHRLRRLSRCRCGLC